MALGAVLGAAARAVGIGGSRAAPAAARAAAPAAARGGAVRPAPRLKIFNPHAPAAGGGGKGKGGGGGGGRGRGIPAPTNTQEHHNGWDVLNKATNVGFGLQSWLSLFENWMPSYISTAECTVIGKKGTPTKNVLHTALAAVFGAMFREGPRYGDFGLEVHVDHINNVVTTSYVVKTNVVNQITNKVVANPGILLDAATGQLTGRALKKLSQIAFEGAPWISIIGAAGGQLGLIPLPAGGGISGVRRSAPNAQGLNGTTGLGGAYNTNDPSEINAVTGQPEGTILSDQLANAFKFLTMGFGPALWADPANPAAARVSGAVARETIEGAPPPALLRPPGEYPAPFNSLVLYETIITRLPKVPPGELAQNPIPPVPAPVDDKGIVVQEYNKMVPVAIPGTDPADGLPFDLRSLVAQALTDPTVEPPRPESDQQFKQVERP